MARSYFITLFTDGLLCNVQEPLNSPLQVFLLIFSLFRCPFDDRCMNFCLLECSR